MQDSSSNLRQKDGFANKNDKNAVTGETIFYRLEPGSSHGTRYSDILFSTCAT